MYVKIGIRNSHLNVVFRFFCQCFGYPYKAVHYNLPQSNLLSDDIFVKTLFYVPASLVYWIFCRFIQTPAWPFVVSKNLG